MNIFFKLLFGCPTTNLLCDEALVTNLLCDEALVTNLLCDEALVTNLLCDEALVTYNSKYSNIGGLTMKNVWRSFITSEPELVLGKLHVK